MANNGMLNRGYNKYLIAIFGKQSIFTELSVDNDVSISIVPFWSYATERDDDDDDIQANNMTSNYFMASQ